MKGIITALQGTIQKHEVFLFDVEELYMFSAKLGISSLYLCYFWKGNTKNPKECIHL